MPDFNFHKVPNGHYFRMRAKSVKTSQNVELFVRLTALFLPQTDQSRLTGRPLLLDAKYYQQDGYVDASMAF